jgi:hypothetical protein
MDPRATEIILQNLAAIDPHDAGYYPAKAAMGPHDAGYYPAKFGSN